MRQHRPRKETNESGEGIGCFKAYQSSGALSSTMTSCLDQARTDADPEDQPSEEPHDEGDGGEER